MSYLFSVMRPKLYPNMLIDIAACLQEINCINLYLMIRNQILQFLNFTKQI